MRIAVLGAGSIGCFVGGVWTARGCDVTFVGRRRVMDEVRAHGLRLSDYAGWSASMPPEQARFTADPAALAHADVILLTVKSNGTEAAATEIARHAKKEAAVVSLQNGVGNADLLRRLLPGRTVLAGMVPYNVAHLGGGRWHKGTAGQVIVEEGEISAGLKRMAGDSPAALALSGDMPAILWGKLVINLNNAVNALSGKPLLAQLRERGYRRVVAAAQREALGLLKEAGIKPAKVGALPSSLLPHALAAPDWLFNALLLRAHKVDANARTSMADDFAAGRPTEIDHLNGEVVALAERLGRTAPVNRRIVALVRAAEKGGRRDWRADELAKEVLG
ncbi:2-dehydropantoate 2-reductase [Allosphingosinicella flava]|uniref:2-dehydropantoate 2-reductase n=1 Tax=Allosphingosinicella flava TaxID=2771430 RepID=A0A7T2LLY6_9SPHN|nr:2-dehydropantoate 2-reductase [Sphingosinicella flava]QPQ55000.1 2-dehydropantoate 2-reductase [Sphingosinicella flava]